MKVAADTAQRIRTSFVTILTGICSTFPDYFQHVIPEARLLEANVMAGKQWSVVWFVERITWGESEMLLLRPHLCIVY